MKVKFIRDVVWSMNGIDPKEYKKGEVIEVDEKMRSLLKRNDYADDFESEVEKKPSKVEEKAVEKAPKNKMFKIKKQNKEKVNDETEE